MFPAYQVLFQNTERARREGEVGKEMASIILQGNDLKVAHDTQSFHIQCKAAKGAMLHPSVASEMPGRRQGLAASHVSRNHIAS